MSENVFRAGGNSLQFFMLKFSLRFVFHLNNHVKGTGSSFYLSTRIFPSLIETFFQHFLPISLKILKKRVQVFELLSQKVKTASLLDNSMKKVNKYLNNIYLEMKILFCFTFACWISRKARLNIF